MVLVTAAAAVAIVMGVVIVGWPALQEYRSLRRLREHPDLFARFLFAGTPVEKAAAARFLKERAGKERLFRIYLNELDNAGFGIRNLLQRYRDKKISEAGILVLRPAGIEMYTLGRSRGHSSIGMRPNEPERRARVLELLEACRGESFTVGGYEGYEFLIEKYAGKGKRQPAPAWPALATSKAQTLLRNLRLADADFVCFYRVLK